MKAILRVLAATLLTLASAFMPAATLAQEAGGGSRHEGHDAHAGHVAADAPLRDGAASLPRTPVPVLTDADRAAAVPASTAHPVHDNAFHAFLLADRLEAWKQDGAGYQGWEISGWAGTDTDRAWLRSRGTRSDEGIEDADIELFYGRSISPWWELLAGVRHDARPREARTFGAIGLQGRTPFFVEGSLLAYAGEGGRTAARLDAHYDMHFSGRLVLQWKLEADVYGRGDASRGLGAGLAQAALGARLRYEITRRFAPYAGIAHERTFGRTARLREAAGMDADPTRIVLGLRTWF